jgi:hypothetical protein
MKQVALLATCFMLVSCSPSSNLKMEVTCSSEASVDLQWTTRRYIPEVTTFLKRVQQKYDVGTQWNIITLK